ADEDLPAAFLKHTDPRSTASGWGRCASGIFLGIVTFILRPSVFSHCRCQKITAHGPKSVLGSRIGATTPCVSRRFVVRNPHYGWSRNLFVLKGLRHDAPMDKPSSHATSLMDQTA